MNILQTPVRFPPYTGGVESYVHDLSKNLVNLGHNVNVICAKATEESSVREIIDGIQVSRLRSVGKIAQTNITPAFPFRLLAQARDADIIHSHIPTPWSADFSAAVAEITGTPYVVTYHNDIVGEGVANQIASLYNMSALKFTLGVADRILITQPGYLNHSNHLQKYEEKIKTISNGVDINKFSPTTISDREKKRLGFSAERQNLFFLSVLDKYHRYKGLDVLLEAMVILKQNLNPAPQLVVGGAGELKSEYESFASELGVSDLVHFSGYIPEDDLVSAFNAANVFVLPSLSSDQEGFGLVILESLACCTPVVTTDVVGIAGDIKNEDLGTIADVGDAKSLAEGVQKELASETSSKGKRGRNKCVNSHSWESSARNLEAVYKELI